MREFHRGSGGISWLFVAYLGLLLWAPIPLGSNRPWSWTVLELWIFALAICWTFEFARGRAEFGGVVRAARPALLSALLWLAYVWLQLLPLPMPLLQLLSPDAAHWHTAAAKPLSVAVAPLTLDRAATLDGALKSAAYVTFFGLSLAVLSTRERIAATMYALVISGVIQAIYAGLLALSTPGEVAHGFFVNRNHLAGYLSMCLAAGLGLLISELTGDRAQDWRQFARNVIAWILSPKMQLRLALVVMVIALVLTRSRMGNSAFFLSMLTTGAIALLLAKRASKSIAILVASLVIIDIAIVGAYFGVQRVVERIEETRIGAEDRSALAADALRMWMDYPFFGAGLGSFRNAFARYPQQDLGALYTHAHNDYLEFLCEAGLTGMGLLATLVCLSFLAALRAQIVRRDPLMRALSFAAMMAIIAMGMHSAVDFNLQIPANALTFILLLAFAWIALHYRPGELGDPEDESGAAAGERG